MMSKDMRNSHVMIKQGITWYNPEAEIRTVKNFVNFIL